MNNKNEMVNSQTQKGAIQAQSNEQILTLQKMRELQKELEIVKDQEKVIKDIIKIDNVQLSPMLKLNEAYLVEIEDRKKELEYQLYTENGLIGISNQEGLIELDSKYIAEMDEKFGQYGSEYLIPVENRTLDPIVLQQQSLEPYRQSQLEKNNGQLQEQEEVDKDKEKSKSPNTNMTKMEADLGCDISSCVRIEDDDFSQEVLGHQTGHKEKYIAYSKSRNTFILIGQNGNSYEEIRDICGAQGGREAATKTYREYDENGRAIDVEAPSFVMNRNDGTQGALAIDMHYGAICVSSLTPNEEKPGKYVSEEINIGHSVRPTPDEIEQAKERDEQAKAIKEKEKEVDSLESDVSRGENKIEELRDSKEELEDMKQQAQDEDDIYDWSTGRPVPRH